MFFLPYSEVLKIQGCHRKFKTRFPDYSLTIHDNSLTALKVNSTSKQTVSPKNSGQNSQFYAYHWSTQIIQKHSMTFLWLLCIFNIFPWLFKVFPDFYQKKFTLFQGFPGFPGSVATLKNNKGQNWCIILWVHLCTWPFTTKKIFLRAT